MKIILTLPIPGKDLEDPGVPGLYTENLSYKIFSIQPGTDKLPS